jgi:hypothetical protein
MDRLETGGLKRLRCVNHELFRSTAALLQSGILFKESGLFDYVDKQTSPLGAAASQYLCCRIGKSESSMAEVFSRFAPPCRITSA